MHPDVQHLLQSPYEVAPLTREVVIYGAGNTGREVGAYLAQAGHTVLAFLDAAARPGQLLQRVAVHRPADWPQRQQAPELDVVVAVHNYQVDMVALLGQIGGMGFRRTVNMIDFHNLFPADQPWRYWLAPRSFYKGREAEMDAARALLGDDTSRAWYDGVLAFRLSGDFARLPENNPMDQYAPADLPRWADPMRIIDCGAFNGDTIAALAHVGYTFDAIAAFEPDPANFLPLAVRASRHGAAFCFPCGVAESTRQVRFQSGSGMGSHEAADGNVTIQCVAIDQALSGFRPTHVKMDIEGAEIDALKGAQRTIAAHRPSLAIALYHQPEHLWEIPLLIDSWGLGYRYEIRGHAYNSYDTDLYAFPSARPALPAG
jgi:FkbM family methyltransferase